MQLKVNRTSASSKWILIKLMTALNGITFSPHWRILWGSGNSSYPTCTPYLATLEPGYHLTYHSPTPFLSKDQSCRMLVAPLLYAIAKEGLTMLVVDKMSKGHLKGISLPNSQNQLTSLQLFTSDSNALIRNHPEQIASFWACLDNFRLALGSHINNSKMVIKMLYNPPSLHNRY